MNTTFKKKAEEKTLSTLAYGGRVKRCSSPRVVFILNIRTRGAVNKLMAAFSLFVTNAIHSRTHQTHIRLAIYNKLT